MGETVLSLKNIVMRYGDVSVLASASIDVRAGELLGVRGTNGAGKTTLLEIMAGTVKPVSGSREASQELMGRITYVPQDIALYESLTGRQNLYFWEEAYGISGKAKKLRADYLLKELDLLDKANKRVETYSGGMKRRLNLAAALVITPKLLLLDEPTVGADAKSVESMLKLITSAKNAGSAVVLVSHIDNDLDTVCDRVVTLKDGKIQ